MAVRVALVASLLFVSSAAHADGPGKAAPDEDPKSKALINRPHTIAELEAGIIALPNAPISSGQRGGNAPLFQIGKGDATIQTGLHLLYRAGGDFAIGAGLSFAPRPTSDPDYGIGGLSGLPRTHSRSYLLIGTEGRYIPFHTRFFEAWVGITAGGVVIADRFSTTATQSRDQVPTILGVREVTIRTEGFAVGVQAGGSYIITDRWVAGVALRIDRWLLPNSPQCSPIGDCATLTGTVAAFETGLTVGYRLPL